MTKQESLPFLCSARSLIQVAKEELIPWWSEIIEDANVHFLIGEEQEREELSKIAAQSKLPSERIFDSFNDFVSNHSSFGLLSLDGEDFSAEISEEKDEIVRITYLNRRSNPDLSAALARSFAQKSDLVLADYLPEESIQPSDSPVSLPDSFIFHAPNVAAFPDTARSENGPLLWIVDATSMTSGPTNHKVATTLGKMQVEKETDVISMEPGSPSLQELRTRMSKAKGVLVVTGDPMLGHYLVRSANLLAIPISFPIEEPCSPLRFTSDELTLYLAYNNYGRTGMSTRGLLSKAVESVSQNSMTKASLKEGSEEQISVTSRWLNLLERKKNGDVAPSSNPSAYELIDPKDGQTDADAKFHFVPPTQAENSTFEATLTPRQWMESSSLAEAVLSLQSQSDVDKSIPRGIADFLAEHLLALKPSAKVAGQLFRAIAESDPEWLLRTCEKMKQWKESGVFLDVARCIHVSHPDQSEILSGSLSERRKEYEGLVALLDFQLDANVFSTFIVLPLFRFLSALDLIEERIESIMKLFAAYPSNERPYRSFLGFFKAINGNTEDAQGLLPNYNDASNLGLPFGHMFLFTGIKTNAITDPRGAVSQCLTEGQFEKWSKGLPWDRTLMALILGLLDLQEEARSMMDEAVASHPHLYPFSDLLSQISELSPSAEPLVSEDQKKDLRQILSQGK